MARVSPCNSQEGLYDRPQVTLWASSPPILFAPAALASSLLSQHSRHAAIFGSRRSCMAHSLPPSGLYANVTFSAKAFLTTLFKTINHGPLGLLYFIFLLNPKQHLPCAEFYLVF